MIKMCSTISCKYIIKFVILMQANIYLMLSSSFSGVCTCVCGGCLCFYGWVGNMV